MSSEHSGVEIKGANPNIKREAGRSRGAKVVVCGVVSFVILFLVFILPTGIFTESFGELSPQKIIEQITTNTNYLAAVFAGSGSAGNYGSTVFRYCAAFLAGATLGVVGATFQGTFKNPLASPSTLGVVSGSLFGAIAYNIFLVPQSSGIGTTTAAELTQTIENLNAVEYVWSIYGASICALLGGLIVVGVALAISRVLGSGTMGTVLLIVVGQVFTMVFNVLDDTLLYYFNAIGDYYKAARITNAQQSPFTMFYSFQDLAAFAVPVVVLLAILLLMRTRLDVMSFSDEEARTSGVDVSRLRTLMVVICAAATGLVVGCCGPIAFVGFVCPHVARRIVGPSFRYLLPASLFVGAAFLVVVLFASYQIDFSINQGLNLISTTIGCIVFIFVAMKNRGGAHAWS